MSIQTCPTTIVEAPADRVWRLLTIPAEFQRWTGLGMMICWLVRCRMVRKFDRIEPSRLVTKDGRDNGLSRCRKSWIRSGLF